MQQLKRPDAYVLRGEEAVEALEAYISELEENQPEELTSMQTEALIKLAKGLISAVDSETTLLADIKRSPLLLRMKHTAGTLLTVCTELSVPITSDSVRPQESHYHPPPNRLV